MTLRRGFKSEANGYSRDFRDELGLEHRAPLCPWTLSRHLEIPIIPVSYFQSTEPSMVLYFSSESGRSAFSAMTLFEGRFRRIIYNDAHHRRRQAADIAHELAHCILHHPPKPPIAADGSRHYDHELEEEANWLGPTLLISEEASLWIAEQNMLLSDAASHFGVSVDLVRMRLNVTGAAKRIARRRVA